MPDLNTVTITGNLTRDPELRQVGANGTSICDLRVAVNGREKQGEKWVDRPNFFDVTVWGRQGESAHTYLERGRPVAITGELRWREWTAEDNTKRQAVSITAEKVKFLAGGNGQGPRPTAAAPEAGQQPAAQAQQPVAMGAQEPAAQPQQAAQPEGAAAVTEGGGEDDLPF